MTPLWDLSSALVLGKCRGSRKRWCLARDPCCLCISGRNGALRKWARPATDLPQQCLKKLPSNFQRMAGTPAPLHQQPPQQSLGGIRQQSSQTRLQRLRLSIRLRLRRHCRLFLRWASCPLWMLLPSGQSRRTSTWTPHQGALWPLLSLCKNCKCPKCLFVPHNRVVLRMSSSMRQQRTPEEAAAWDETAFKEWCSNPTRGAAH